jgi:hypothetical protein
MTTRLLVPASSWDKSEERNKISTTPTIAKHCSLLFFHDGGDHSSQSRPPTQSCVGNTCHSGKLSSWGRSSSIQPQEAPIETPTHHSYHAWLSEILSTHPSTRVRPHKLMSHANFESDPSCVQSTGNHHYAAF